MGSKAPDDGDSPAPEPSGEGRPPARFFGRRVTPQSPNEALQPERPPPPPVLHRRRPGLSAVSGFLSFLMIIAVGGLFGVLWGAQRIREPGPLAADKVLYIAPGTDFPDVVATLDSEGVIDNELLFNLAVMLEGKRSKIKAGEYLFKRSASMRDVIELLVSGRQVLHSVTIPEGLTSEQIVERLSGNTLLAGDIREIPKEGSLLPETYKVTRGMTRSALIKRMQEDEKKLVARIWANRDSGLILHSPYELVTLASIVEKETGKADERPRVAAVFLNRLRKHMKLQSDPTIVYGLVGGKGTLGRPIQRSEVEKPTPYNTYVIPGLPPGPIANPGRAALEAVANPSRTQDLYFVADGTGGHVFAQTLEQHLRNVHRWRQIEKAAQDKEKPGTAVDKVAPLPPAGKPEQHGALEGGTVYGALPGSANFLAGGIQAPSLGVASAVATFARVAPALPSPIATAAPTPGRAAAHRNLGLSSLSALVMEPGIDKLGLSVRGVPDPHASAALLDGPVDASGGTAAPANAGARSGSVAQAQAQAQAEERAVAAALDERVGAPAVSSGRATTTTRQQHDGQGIHPAVFDASEGTPFDPLRDKTYDLNYPKTVPSSAPPR
jgi:UPF0755 protein